MSHFPLTASISKVILAYMLQRLQVVELQGTDITLLD